MRPIYSRLYHSKVHSYIASTLTDTGELSYTKKLISDYL